MFDFPQPDLEKALRIFPKIGFIGGIIGHRLDIHAGCVKSCKVRISIPGKGVIALEQVVIYGRISASSKILNLTNLVGNITHQSSTRADETPDLYASKKAINGIFDGYNRAETNLEENPYWEIVFPREYILETIHVSNFSAPGYAENHSNLVIDYLNKGNFHTIYRRDSQCVLQFKLAQILETLTKLSKLTARTPQQRQAKDSALSSFKDILLEQEPQHTTRFSEYLLDCVEAFLPISLEPKNKSYQLRDLALVSAIRVSGVDNEALEPQININFFDPNDSLTSTIGHLQTNDSIIFFEKPYYIVSLDVSFKGKDRFYLANNFRIELIQNHDPHGEEKDLWFVAYDNAEIARLCKDLAWLSFLAGNDSARCIGLISKPSVMARRNEVELLESYMWCRLNLHGKPQAFKDIVTDIVNSANQWDDTSTRLSFGRHSFSTCLGHRDQDKYVDSLKRTIHALEQKNFDAMLLYGTLLGAVRSGKFIEHDDDVDIGYVSHSRTREELIEERKKIISQFESANFSISDFSNHLTFSVSHKDFIQPCWVEIFPIWRDPENSDNYLMYMTTMTVQSVPKFLIGSVKDRASVFLNNEIFPAPADPAGFLSLRYGCDWNIPDPFFEI